MSVVLVLKEAGMGVFLQLLGVFHKKVVKLSLLHLPPGPKLTVVWHMDLERGNVERKKGIDGEKRKKREVSTSVICWPHLT